MKRLLMVAMLAAGCSGSPVQPESVAPQLAVAVAQAVPAETPPPPPAVPTAALTVTGGRDCSLPVVQEDVLSWGLQVGPRTTALHLRVLAFHGRKAGCSSTEDRGTASVIDIVGPLDYAAGTSGETTFKIRASHFTCGRVQFDVQGYEGGDIFGIIGNVFDYGVDCAEEVAAPPPPVVPPPAPPAVTPADCRTALRNVDISRVGPNLGRLTFRIASGYANVQISLISYTTTPGVFLPQTFFDGVSGTFNAGGTYQLTVQMPQTPGWQGDAMCGPLDRSDLTAANFPGINARTFAWMSPSGVSN
jgi:hypothetical protein